MLEGGSVARFILTAAASLALSAVTFAAESGLETTRDAVMSEICCNLLEVRSGFGAMVSVTVE